MNRYPLFLNLQGRKAAVFGAGKVALRKIKLLLQSGAKVEVMSREYAPEIQRLASVCADLKLKSKASIAAILKNAALAFAATSDQKFNERVAGACRKKKIWVNVADRPDLCDFFVPSFFKKGKLEIAISTGGASPILARKLRQELSRKIRPEAVRLMDQMSRARVRAAGKIASQKERSRFLEKKIGGGFQFLANGNGAAR